MKNPAGINEIKTFRQRAVARGIILPIVLIIFMLLGMLAVGFSLSTRSDAVALKSQTTMEQARNCAVSGIETAALLLRQKFEENQYWYDNQSLFANQPLDQEKTITDEKKNSWRYTLVGYNLDSQDTVRYGLTDEAGKVNINVASEDQLSRLPGVTPEMAASIINWRGGTPNQSGAKDDYYMSLHQPYHCKKAPFDTVEELLLVKGFSGKELFGEDMNRNGILDPNENDGKASLPIDNADGVLDRGLYPYITVYSREPEVSDSDPYSPRINIKDWPDLVIKQMLEKHLRKEVLDFIIQAKNNSVDFGESPASLLEGTFKDKNGNELKSPVTLDDIASLMDYTTTGYHISSDGFAYGRINVNTAPKTVLQTIKKLTDAEIDTIIATRSKLDTQMSKNIAWLVTQGVLTPEKFKQVAYLLTARSYQFTVESVGYHDNQPVQARIQAVLELRLPRVQYIYWRDLTGLGRAYNVADFGETKLAVKQ